MVNEITDGHPWPRSLEDLYGYKWKGLDQAINKGVILAGPWIGEFGHELFSWQGALRLIAKNHSEKMIVICRKGRECLYEDFASEIISIEVDCEDCVNEWCKKIPQEVIDKIDEIYESTPHTIALKRRLPSKSMGSTGTYIRYGKPNESLRYDIVVHARNIYKTPAKGDYADFDMQRNWSKKNWEELLSRYTRKGLWKIACIGTRSSAHLLDGCEDCLDQPLKETLDLLYNSRLIIGPSSGPMHLAALSNCPVITWNNENTHSRYEHQWNPFKETLYYLKQEPSRFTKKGNAIYNSPSVDEVDRLLKRALENEK